jgi:hypothetical protein
MSYRITNVRSTSSAHGTQFRTAIFSEGGKWWFRWSNMTNFGQPPGDSVKKHREGPFDDESAAEAARQRFIKEERRKRPLVTFEAE